MNRRKQKHGQRGFAEWILVMAVATIALGLFTFTAETDKQQRSRAHYDKLDVERQIEPDDGSVDW